tara:strand:+ start:1593 stop:1874 length:282 start_codon:yes stop_codon:yes gene_type:complete
MEKKGIIIFKRSKHKKFSNGIEYILCTNERPTIMSSSLDTMSSYVTTLSKINGKKVSMKHSVPNEMNSGYFYEKLNDNEKKSLDMYLHRRKNS